MSKGYWVANVDISDLEAYKKYVAANAVPFRKYGGKFLTRGEPVATLEGEAYKDRLVILEFPSQAKAEAWYADPAYQAAVTFRRASSVMTRMLVQQGGGNTEDPDPKL